MKRLEIKSFATRLIGYQWIGEIRLDLLCLEIIENSDSIKNKERYHDSFSDASSKNYDKLIKELNLIIKDNEDCPILKIHDKFGCELIESIGTNKNDTFNTVISLIDEIGTRNNKGVEFEKFCIQFLIDVGISAKPTSISNDKGIDIIGKYSSNTIEMVGKLIKHSDIYILAQAKYFESAIDTPVIRKLVGDSLFIRFDDLEYLEIKHNAFHLLVFTKHGLTEPARKFAIKNKVEYYDAQRIAHIISTNGSLTWKCLQI